jgi:4-diphosphocytidyl-2-C-methyl-D-erythritol kinase
MIVYPNAKINIGLNILNKRADGFHNIESCFFPIKLCDILEIVESNSKTQFHSSGIPIPGDSNNNLCVEAWRILHKNFQIPAVEMHLHKQIPIGAGVGGGSADGAFALKAIAELFNLKLSVKELENYAAQLGSDCAFFIQNTPAFAEGRGELLTEIILNLDSYKLVLINPGIHISTAEAYGGVTPKIPEIKLPRLIREKISEWQGKILNDFEQGVCLKHPEIAEIKRTLIEKGAIYASMSGSGSTVYGIFDSKTYLDLQGEFAGLFCWQGDFMK